MRAAALVVAAGRGERLGSTGPKALVALGGRPLLDWSIAALRATPAIESIVVALPAGWLEAAPAGCVAVAGGVARSHSVRAALAAAPPDAELILVHDAARPLLTASLASACLAALGDDGGWDAAVAAAPVTDTIKRSPDGLAVTETLARSELWAVQTPQAFRRAALERALARPDDELSAATDDASLVELDGGRVRVVPAPRENLKVTTPLDLALAELLLSRERPAAPVGGAAHAAGRGAA
ncbi:MAG: 2-C-methyl-D-erythritol 4-phosphate cytidylyltransferase [Solirubrobacteraceae bacterium]|nr:2-C-methyl-D-erythritol 4-phosphate cytidylyltransferase [Solirubrobacteraceae bacterium]